MTKRYRVIIEYHYLEVNEVEAENEEDAVVYAKSREDCVIDSETLSGDGKVHLVKEVA